MHRLLLFPHASRYCFTNRKADRILPFCQLLSTVNKAFLLGHFGQVLDRDLIIDQNFHLTGSIQLCNGLFRLDNGQRAGIPARVYFYHKCSLLISEYNRDFRLFLFFFQNFAYNGCRQTNLFQFSFQCVGILRCHSQQQTAGSLWVK